MTKRYLLPIIFLISSFQIYSQSWVIQYSDPAQNSLFSVSVVNQRVAWACGDQGRVMKTTDGAYWQDVSIPDNGVILYCIEALSDETAYAGGKITNGGTRIYRTSDGGNSWTIPVDEQNNGAFINFIHFFNAQEGIAISDPSTGSSTFNSYTTSDRGISWESELKPACENDETGYNNCATFLGETGWFGTSDFRIFKTEDGGGSWTPIDINYGHKVEGIAHTSPDVGMALLVLINGLGYWALTTDGWNTYYFVNPPELSWIGTVACVPELDQFWACGSFTEQRASSIFTTTDHGDSFNEQIIEPISENSWFTHLMLKVINDSLYGVAATNKGQILGFHIPVITSLREISSDISYNLFQNYPNPFNPVTTIRYSLKYQAFVELNVYDILGNEIEILVNEEKPSGTFMVNWNAKDLPSGVYFYQIKTGDFIQTRKMILLR